MTIFIDLISVKEENQTEITVNPAFIVALIPNRERTQVKLAGNVEYRVLETRQEIFAKIAAAEPVFAAVEAVQDDGLGETVEGLGEEVEELTSRIVALENAAKAAA